MKVTAAAAAMVLLSIACASASPLFGIGGMMHRKFPGATEMSYHDYRQIANNNAQNPTDLSPLTPSNAAAIPPPVLATDTPFVSTTRSNAVPASSGSSAAAVPIAPSPVGTRTNVGQAPQVDSWMFGNTLTDAQTTIDRRPSLRPVPDTQQYQRGTSSFDGASQFSDAYDYQDFYQQQYPSYVDPRESYAALQFPSNGYHGYPQIPLQFPTHGYRSSYKGGYY